MNKLKKEDFLFYLFLLVPFTYLIGIFITELFLVFLILFFLIKNRDNTNYKDRKIIFLFFFSTYIALNALIQIDDNLKYSSLFHFRYLLFSLSIAFFFQYFENSRIQSARNLLNVFFFYNLSSYI